MSKLDDILDDYTSTWSLDGIAGSDAWLESHIDAKQQIKALFLELIGEDEEYTGLDRQVTQNMIRKQLRQKVNEL